MYGLPRYILLWSLISCSSHVFLASWEQEWDTSPSFFSEAVTLDDVASEIKPRGTTNLSIEAFNSTVRSLQPRSECAIQKYNSNKKKWYGLPLEEEQKDWVGDLPPRSSYPSDPAKAAICISGQMRSLTYAYPYFRDKLIPAFGPSGVVDSFMFLNFDDSDSHKIMNGGCKHNELELRSIMTELNVVALRSYTMKDFHKTKPKIGPCFEKPEADRARHFSWHGPQSWNINQCFQMVTQYEEEKQLRYRWVVRLRPDGARAEWQSLTNAIRQDVLPDPALYPRVWMAWGPVADAFAIMTRPALEPFADIWEEFYGKKCLELPQNERLRRHFCVKVIAPERIAFGTECLIALSLRKHGVELRIKSAFRTGIWGRRGLAKVAWQRKPQKLLDCQMPETQNKRISNGKWAWFVVFFVLLFPTLLNLFLAYR